MAQFVNVGPASAVQDNTMAAFQIGPRRIAVAQVDGRYYGFDDICTHAACSLADGDLEEGTVICPCHMGRFDLATGKVLDGPPPTPVQVYAVRVLEGDLQVEV